MNGEGTEEVGKRNEEKQREKSYLARPHQVGVEFEMPTPSGIMVDQLSHSTLPSSYGNSI